ncbi:transmembrane protein 104 isoform X2 [Nelusetta ayraudi]|uniref:transmembrane protein 104 isoform X2 n=1 Tax=Nelusetta ayraudi TaxID=303726 RepID=UPI003F7027E8
MAGGITETGEPYSDYVGLVYMFNLIVGTGALTMPRAFATAGWVVSLALITFLGFMSYMTTTFMIEAMAAANAQLRWKRREQEETDDTDSASELSDDDDGGGGGRGRSAPETRPILSVQRSAGHADPFDITERVEMGQMASMFFNKVGVNMFYICIIVYLYGDLAIYAAAVPISLMEVACGNHSCSAGSVKYNDTDPCWGVMTRKDAYRVFLSIFTLLLGPFIFFNAQKTKYLQILTSLMRWMARCCTTCTRSTSPTTAACWTWRRCATSWASSPSSPSAPTSPSSPSRCATTGRRCSTGRAAPPTPGWWTASSSRCSRWPRPSWWPSSRTTWSRWWASRAPTPARASSTSRRPAWCTTAGATWSPWWSATPSTSTARRSATWPGFGSCCCGPPPPSSSSPSTSC